MIYLHLHDIPATPRRCRAAYLISAMFSLASSVRVPSPTASITNRLTFDRPCEVHRGLIHDIYLKSILGSHYMYHCEETEMLTIPSRHDQELLFHACETFVRASRCLRSQRSGRVLLSYAQGCTVDITSMTMLTKLVRNLSFCILYDSGYEPLTSTPRSKLILLGQVQLSNLCNDNSVSFGRHSDTGRANNQQVYAARLSCCCCCSRLHLVIAVL